MEKIIIFYPYTLGKRGNRIMCKAIIISEVIINECIERGYPINTSKLQKILYYMQKEHLNRYNIPVFDESIVAWECGPAIEEVNNYFVAGRLGFDTKVEQSIILKDSHQDVLDIVLKEYGAMPPSKVAELSKKEEAWIEVWNDGKGRGCPIPLEHISPPSTRNSFHIEDIKNE